MALGCSGGEPGVWREDIGAIDTGETRQMRSERVDVGSREPWSGTISPAGWVSLRLALQSTRGRRTKPNLWPGLDPGHWTFLWGAQKKNVTALKVRAESRENSVILMFSCCSNRTLDLANSTKTHWSVGFWRKRAKLSKLVRYQTQVASSIT